MGLDQYFMIKNRVSEEERIGMIKSQYFYPIVKPKNVDDLNKYPISKEFNSISTLVGMGGHLDDICLSKDKVWIIGDHDLLSLDKPYYRQHDEVGYFRKFNALQGYFEENYSVQNCEDLELDTESIIKLKNTIEPIVKEYLKEKSQSFRGKSKSKMLAEKLFPASPGFFFGSENYDEYYFDDLVSLINYLDEYIDLIKTFDENQTLVYYCWY